MCTVIWEHFDEHSEQTTNSDPGTSTLDHAEAFGVTLYGAASTLSTLTGFVNDVQIQKK